MVYFILGESWSALLSLGSSGFWLGTRKPFILWLLKLTIITLPNITLSLFSASHYNLGVRKNKPWYRPDELAAHHGTMVLSQAKDTWSGLLLLKKNLIYLSYCTSLFQPGLSSNCFECKDFWPLCWNQASCPSSLISLWRVLSHHPLLIRFITIPKAPGFDTEQLGLIYWHCLSISSLNFNPGFPKSHDCVGDYSEYMEETPLNSGGIQVI